MSDQEEQSLKEAKRAGKRAAEEAEQLTKDQARKKAYLVREEAIEKASKARKTKRTEKRDYSKASTKSRHVVAQPKTSVTFHTVDCWVNSGPILPQPSITRMGKYS